PRPRGTGGGGSSGTSAATPQPGSGTGSGGKTETMLGPDCQPLRELTRDEVINMSSRMEIGTRRCYERALKDDPFLKVTKIKATITVKPSGEVSGAVLT